MTPRPLHLPRIEVVVPVYNEATALAPSVRTLHAFLTRELPFAWEITIADNASCGVFVLGAARVDPRALDLAALRVSVWKNDQPLSQGFGSAVQGSPLASVAWLANTLGGYGVRLDPGEVILSGSLVPLEPARPGDRFRLALEGVGGATISFS